MLEKTQNLDHSPSDDRVAIKEFAIILDRIPLNVPYKISDLEFEFDLSWAKLKPLLDKSARYITNKGESGEEDIIKITDNSGPKIETILDSENLNPKEFEKIIALFYTQNDPFKYTSLDKNNFAGKKDLLTKALRAGVVIYQNWNEKLVLSKFFRKNRKLPNE